MVPLHWGPKTHETLTKYKSWFNIHSKYKEYKCNNKTQK